MTDHHPADDHEGKIRVLMSQEEATSYRLTAYMEAYLRSTPLSSRTQRGDAFTAIASRTLTKKRKLNHSKDSPFSVVESPFASKQPAVVLARNNGPSRGIMTQQGIDLRKIWRFNVCQWAFQVADHLETNREVVWMFMNYLDRYLARVESTTELEDRHKFQRSAMTCLYLALKLFELRHIYINGSSSTLDSIVSLGQGRYTRDEIKNDELKILQTLEWRMHPPTPQTFMHHFLHDLPSTFISEVRKLATFVVELSVLDYFFTSYKASEVAVGALYTAMNWLFSHSTTKIGLESQVLRGRLGKYASPRVQACQERLTRDYSQSIVPTPPPGNDPDPRVSSPVSVTTSFLPH